MAFRRPLVLVADDDPSIRMTLEFVLADEGFTVDVAANGKQALDIALERLPDVILLDLMMPVMSGEQVLAALREEPSTRSIPVLVLTGMAGKAKSEWPNAEFVGKPFSPEKLIARIKSLVTST